METNQLHLVLHGPAEPEITWKMVTNRLNNFYKAEGETKWLDSHTQPLNNLRIF